MQNEYQAKSTVIQCVSDQIGLRKTKRGFGATYSAILRGVECEKNALLRANRNISFEKVVAQIEKGGLLNVVEHHNPTKYTTQRILIVAIESYVYLVPFVQSDTEVMLKTIYPSRKATLKYLPRVVQVAA